MKIRPTINIALMIRTSAFGSASRARWCTGATLSQSRPVRRQGALDRLVARRRAGQDVERGGVAAHSERRPRRVERAAAEQRRGRGPGGAVVADRLGPRL